LKQFSSRASAELEVTRVC